MFLYCVSVLILLLLPELRQLRVKLNIVLMENVQVFIDRQNLQLQREHRSSQYSEYTKELRLLVITKYLKIHIFI